MDESAKTNKSLLIVKSQAQGLTAVESFLRNRDWKIYSTTSIKEALTHMIQNSPAFVMITVDHPNKKVRNLPKILAQAFPCCVISFAEGSSAASYKMLTDSRSEYLLYPPVTGPAVERTVNKYYKDLITKQNAPASERTYDADGNEEKNINIKGGGISAQSLLAQMLGEEGASSGGFISGEGDKSTAAYHPLHGPGTGHDPGDPNFVPSMHGMDPGDYLPRHSGPEETNYDQPYQRKEKSAGGGWAPLDPAAKKTPGPQTDADGFIRTKNHQESIILKGTKEALDKSVISGGPNKSVEEVKDSSNVACIVIESSRFSGYLVAAMGKNRKIDEDFIQRIRDRLFSFLAANGEAVSNEDSMGIKIKEVPFEDWAIECAEFLRKSVHKGDEVAMAFFPYADVKAKIEQSASAEMVAIDLNEIKVDAALEFNLYIYLPTNQKYVLYTPRGGKMYDKQKDKLTKQGVKQVHMLKADVQDFNKYRAQNYLNGKIDEYENIQRVKRMAV